MSGVMPFTYIRRFWADLYRRTSKNFFRNPSSSTAHLPRNLPSDCDERKFTPVFRPGLGIRTYRRSLSRDRMRRRHRPGNHSPLRRRRIHPWPLSPCDDRPLGHVLCRSVPAGQRRRAHTLLGGTSDQGHVHFPTVSARNRDGTGMDATNILNHERYRLRAGPSLARLCCCPCKPPNTQGSASRLNSGSWQPYQHRSLSSVDTIPPRWRADAPPVRAERARRLLRDPFQQSSR